MTLHRQFPALAVTSGGQDIEGGRLPQPRQQLRFSARDQVEQPPDTHVEVVKPDRRTGLVIDSQVGAGGERELPQRSESGIGHQLVHLQPCCRIARKKSTLILLRPQWVEAAGQ